MLGGNIYIRHQTGSKKKLYQLLRHLVGSKDNQSWKFTTPNVSNENIVDQWQEKTKFFPIVKVDVAI